jgi:hypothetical protein
MGHENRRLSVHLLAAGALLVALYALAGFVLVPHLIERHLPDQVPRWLDARATLRDVSFNPFLLRLTAQDVRLEGRSASPVVHVVRLTVDLRWSSLWRRAWRFDEVRLDRPELRMAIGPDGALNLARLRKRAAGTRQREAAPPSPATRSALPRSTRRASSATRRARAAPRKTNACRRRCNCAGCARARETLRVLSLRAVEPEEVAVPSVLQVLLEQEHQVALVEGANHASHEISCRSS